MNGFRRRDFLKKTMATTAWGSALTASGWSLGNPAESPGTGKRTIAREKPVFLATWRFGQDSGNEALATVNRGGSMLDAIESGIRNCESDASNTSVGIGGTPNADGVVQLDAVIMSGPGHRAGAVAGLEDIAHPISVARQVMEQTDHVLLVGDGAKKFALEQGHQPVNLLTENRRVAWEKWKAEQQNVKHGTADDHDTIALVGVDLQGNMYGGCSTSGRGYKLAGRVGDSPIVGAGLYVDNTAGAAGATGVGENVMRYCGSFLIVEFMRNGLSPRDACFRTIERIADLDPLGFDQLEINFIALNREGEFGAVGTSRGFQCAVVDPNSSAVHDADIVS